MIRCRWSSAWPCCARCATWPWTPHPFGAPDLLFLSHLWQHQLVGRCAMLCHAVLRCATWPWTLHPFGALPGSRSLVGAHTLLVCVFRGVLASSCEAYGGHSKPLASGCLPTCCCCCSDTLERRMEDQQRIKRQTFEEQRVRRATQCMT